MSHSLSNNQKPSESMSSPCPTVDSVQADSATSGSSEAAVRLSCPQTRKSSAINGRRRILLWLALAAMVLNWADGMAVLLSLPTLAAVLNLATTIAVLAEMMALVKLVND